MKAFSVMVLILPRPGSSKDICNPLLLDFKQSFYGKILFRILEQMKFPVELSAAWAYYQILQGENAGILSGYVFFCVYVWMKSNIVHFIHHLVKRLVCSGIWLFRWVRNLVTGHEVNITFC